MTESTPKYRFEAFDPDNEKSPMAFCQFTTDEIIRLLDGCSPHEIVIIIGNTLGIMAMQSDVDRTTLDWVLTHIHNIAVNAFEANVTGVTEVQK